ncbi:MAG: hypothetical protein IPJ69_14000 [Deltaproteobacteria bacterium]|nr:MAG: hypothetical protein IPJ69_14000 [Deltaproteobacteria bacterium]
MQFKLPNTLSKILLSFLLLFISISRLEAYPDQERAALSSLLSSQATSMALESNKYLYVTYGTGIKRIDLSTWELATDQIPDLTDRTSSNGPNLTGTINGLAVKDRTLFATQSDGDIIIVDLDHVTSVPTTVHITSGSSGALGAVVADPETGTDDDKLYILDKATNGVYIYDISLQTASRFSLLDELAVSVAPTSLVFMANTDVPDKIFITSSAGLVFTIYEGTASVGGRTRLSPTSKELPSAALTPDNKFLLVVNSTDNKVHVIDAGSLLEVDTDTDSTSNKAILLPDNGSLKSISIINVTHPTDTYAYVTGANGVSVIDLNISNGTFDLPVSVLDFNHTGPSDTAYNPMAITSPGLITSTVDHNLITSNGNATFSVISDNPFVTIGSSSLGTGTLSSTGSYTLTFQSDEVGTYSVKVGGSLISSGTSAGAGTGTEVASGTISTADEDVTTSSISYNSSLYSEGENLIYIFVTDSNGNIGHDAKTITVDTPPPPVTITSTGFGNNFITVTFNRLTTSDLNHYNIYVATSASAVQTATTASATVSQPSSGSSVTATVSGLTNLTTYYVAIESVDN